MYSYTLSILFKLSTQYVLNTKTFNNKKYSHSSFKNLFWLKIVLNHLFKLCTGLILHWIVSKLDYPCKINKVIFV